MVANFETRPTSTDDARECRASRRALRFAPVIAVLLGAPALAMVAASEVTPTSAEASPALATVSARLPLASFDPELAPARAGTRSSDGEFEAATAPFDVKIGERAISHEVMAVTIFPGATMEVGISDPSGAGGYSLRFGSGTLVGTTPDGWTWSAPSEPGIYALRVEAEGSTEAVHVNVIALHPSEHVSGGELHGYRIGQYQERPLRGDPAYLAPAGFAEVPVGAEDVLVSPHFTIGQFLCKQEGDPRFLALSMPLVRKLEAVLARANESGIKTPTLHVMSGFRTPWYNAAIGNTTVYSRHLWGDAADVFVDVDGDFDMDDLNGDGLSDHRDARVLADLVEEVEAFGRSDILAGGIGLYRRASHRGPFVHVDARGTAARW